MTNELQLAVFHVDWADGSQEDIEVQFNPTEMSLTKGAQIAEVPIPGIDSPVLQFVRGQTEKLTLDLFFDTTDGGMDASATSVTTRTDAFYRLVKIERETHAPPVCEFRWNLAHFPGADVPANYARQARHSFRCVVESVTQKFTLFSPQGVPLRATLNVVLREYKHLDEQLKQLGLESPDRTRSQVVQRGDTLSGLAGKLYGTPGDWRRLADANRITDPRRLVPGTMLTVPPV
jgi:hypothetical protein